MKRAVDVVVSSAALLVVAPLLALLMVLVRVESRGPALFRQLRVGKGGSSFCIYKLRSMYVDADKAGLGITAAGDARITRVGRWLRRTKLDELPQLWNVLRGEMSLVGPRPELQRYVAVWPARARDKILSVRPGITDEAALLFRDEERLLSQVADPEKYYVTTLLPQKLAIYERYVEQQTLAGDLRIIFRTALALVRRR